MSKIFVSSTFKDLKECREKVRLVLRQMGHEDVAMEYFVAEDQRPVDKCLDAVALCDLYVGIFAWRYGYVPPEYDISITELEYRKAVEAGKECLIFQLHEEAPWLPKYVDKGDEAQKIASLREELSDKHSPSSFRSCEELAKNVSTSISNWEKKKGLTSKTKEIIPELDIETYSKAIERKYQTLDLDTLTPSQKENYLKVQLSNIFVEQNVRENPPPIELPKEVLKKIQEEWDVGKEYLPEGFTKDDIKKANESYYSKIPSPVIDVITDKRNKYNVILGDPGSGKSTLSRYILLSILNINQDDRINKRFDGYLPLLIELREFVGLCSENKCKTFLDYFQHLGETQGYHLKKEDIHKYLKDNGKALVIFDGLDEIFDPKEWETASRMIAGFTLDYSKVQILVTSRHVGYKSKILEDAGFNHFTLQDFEEKHIKIFLDKWYSLALFDDIEEVKDRKNRIINSLRDSMSIRQLAGNPLLLTILAIIGKHQELPRERWKLYDHAAGVLVEHWEVNRHLKNEKLDVDFIGEEDKKELLRRIAFKMQSSPEGLAGNFIHKKELKKEIKLYLEERYKEKPAKAKVIADSIIDQLRKRNFILCLHGADFYGFIHRTFLEYFCASAIVEKFNDHEIDISNLKIDFYEKYWENQTWHEVLRLICGIKEKLAGDIIQHLMQVYHPQWFGSRLPWNIVLATKCLSEVRNPGSIDDISKKLLLRIFELFEMASWTQNIEEFLSDEIVPATKLVGTNWSHQDIIAERFDKTHTYLSRYTFEEINFSVTNNWAEFVTVLGFNSLKLYQVIEKKLSGNDSSKLLAVLTLGKYKPINENIHSTLLNSVENEENYYVRRVALAALVEGWHDDLETLPLLKDFAVNDRVDDVRSTALRELAEGWHDDPEILDLLKDRAKNDQNASIRSTAVRGLVDGWHDDPEILDLLKDRAKNDRNEYVRSFALRKLVGGWHDDPETLPLLKDFAVNDRADDVRSTAVEALAEGWHDDPETLPLLKDFAVDDRNGYTRGFALRKLVEGWHDDPETLPLLKDFAVNDLNNYVRSTAVEALAEGWHDDPETLPLLKDFAVNNRVDDVRSTALHELAEGWHDDPETLPLLKDRAKNDRADDARSTALRALAEGWHDDPETLPLLKDRAVNDLNNYVRSTAVEALAEGWHYDPEILPLLKDRAKNDRAKNVRSTAISELAIGYYEDSKTLDLLKDLAKNDRADDVQQAAIQILAWL